MDDRPRNLRSMLAEAKDLSELMVDLAYASVCFGHPELATEVRALEEQMSDLVHDMRAVCVKAARRPRDAGGMSSVLQVVSAIERIANAAVDIARVVTHQLGIPAELVVSLSVAEEVSHRAQVAEGSAMAHRPVGALELPVATGTRIMAIRRGRQWITGVAGDDVLMPGDALFMRGSPEGIPRIRELAGDEVWVPPEAPPEPSISDLDRAADLLVEMKNVSEVAVDLAYSTLVLGDPGLAAQVRHLESRLDDMHDQLELWVLRAAADRPDPAPLRGLLHISNAAEDLGDQASQMVWLIEKGEDVHPILEIALGDSDEVVVDYPVAEGSPVDGRSLGELGLNIEPGFTVLTILRGQRYLYRPRGPTVLQAGDEVIASGPDEGRGAFATLLGWDLERDPETGTDELSPRAAVLGAQT
ncbi:MAG: potassium channel protein [bacterium]|nr:potassium channel protein [bacterium]